MFWRYEPKVCALNVAMTEDFRQPENFDTRAIHPAYTTVEDKTLNKMCVFSNG